MEFLNRFIDWKKNIESIQIEGFVAKFDMDLISFEELLFLLKNKIYLLKNEYLNSAFEGELYEIESFGDGKLLTIEDTKTRAAKIRLDENIVINKNIKTIDLKIYLPELEVEFIQEILNCVGFNMGIFYNPNYIRWVNNDRPESYKYTKGIRTYFKKRLGIESVDISNRPGRYILLKKHAWHGGNEYWFSHRFLKSFDLEKLRKIDERIKVKLLPNDIIHIWLFEPDAYWEENAQKILAKFRDLLLEWQER